jgi:hypothetical protein
LAILVSVLFGLLGAVQLALGAPGDAGKVGVCHLTDDQAEPIVFIEVDEKAVKTHERHGDQVGVASLAECVLPTVVPPTATSVPPTATSAPPTATSIPPTATAAPNTPTFTPVPTSTFTPVPTATDTPVPTATFTPVPPSPTPTTTPLPPIHQTCSGPITITLQWIQPPGNLDARLHTNTFPFSTTVSATSPSPFTWITFVSGPALTVETITIGRDTSGQFVPGTYHLTVQNMTMDAPFTSAYVTITGCNGLLISYFAVNATGNPAHPTWDVFELRILDPGAPS